MSDLCPVSCRVCDPNATPPEPEPGRCSAVVLCTSPTLPFPAMGPAGDPAPTITCESGYELPGRHLRVTSSGHGHPSHHATLLTVVEPCPWTTVCWWLDNFNGQATVSCNDGYTLVGVAPRCGPDGLWTPGDNQNFPRCEQQIVSCVRLMSTARWQVTSMQWCRSHRDVRDRLHATWCVNKTVHRRRTCRPVARRCPCVRTS